MTREEMNARLETLCEELFFEVSDEANRLFRSGGIDPDNYGDDFILPRTLLHVSLLNLANKYKPSPKFIGDARNLRKF